jgi:DNA (cytosine-5)-methyltransferase 1
MPDKDNFGALLQVSTTLRAKAAASHRLDTDTYIPVPYTKAKRAQSDTDDETWVEGQVNPTLSLFDCGDVRATTIAIQGNLIGRDKGGPQGVGASTEGAMYTMTKADVHGVAHAFYSTGGSHGLNQQPEVCPPIKVGSSLGIPSPPAVVQCVAPTITAGNNPSRSPQSSEVTQQVAAVYANTMTVRRLTPRECERLQGFPDDYTLIPWRKKAAEDCPDGPRYKALGNSMAVNCMEWIGERIAAFEAKQAS